MTIRIRRYVLEGIGTGRGVARLVGVLVMAFVICAVPTRGITSGRGLGAVSNGGQFCTATANAIFRACGFEVQDDFWIAVAVCINESEAAERAECLREAEASRNEGNQLCRQQLAGRLDACKSTGEDRYDPEFDAADFDRDFRNLPNPNPYFPMRIGNRWEFRGGDEFNTVEVLNQTKLIDGVTCVVFRDLVFKNGDLMEATDDWYAPAKNGDAWYCGEEVKDFESFAGDRPLRPELVSIDGSFKAGRDGAKPGIIFLAHPTPGDTYIEEFSLGNAEDVTQVLSTNYAFGNDPRLDRSVPRRLAQLLCHGDCVVTKNFSLLEPGIFALKYYAPGIGIFLEVESTGPVIQLVNCSFDPRCAALPRP